MAHHEALFRFSTQHAQQIYLAIVPELYAGEAHFRSTTSYWLEGPSTLVLKIEAEDTPALRAALNMILRLVDVAQEVQVLVRKQ